MISFFRPKTYISFSLEGNKVKSEIQGDKKSLIKMLAIVLDKNKQFAELLQFASIELLHKKIPFLKPRKKKEVRLPN